MFSTRVRPKRRMKGKRIVKREREKREPQRKSLGFHIQLRVYSNVSRAHFEGKLPHSLSLYEDLKSALQRHRRERIEAFSVSLVSRLLFSVFALYSNRQRRSLYREKSICALGKNPHRLCHEVRFVFSLVVFVCLSLSPRACTSRERESACCSWYFNLGCRVSRSLSVSVLFLVVHVCSRRIERERINWGHHGEDEREQETQRKSRSHLSFLC